MKCPYCDKDMKKGFVRALGRGGICWVKDKNLWSEPRSDDGFVQLGKASWLTADHVPAFNCETCGIIIIDYKDDKDEDLVRANTFSSQPYSR